MPEHAGFQQPAFHHPRVRAMMSTRAGGVSPPPYDGLNLAWHVGDDTAAVSENRARFARSFGMPMVRLEQVHGAEVVTLSAAAEGAAPRADGSATAVAGVGCEVQVADCLPVLFAHRGGRAVAAAHAGWRGLAAGVLEAALTRCMQLAEAPAGDIEAWLGPCIGPERFEVGAPVLTAFGRDPQAGTASRFVARPGIPGKWWGDLVGLARDRLIAAGVRAPMGNDGSAAWCTVQQSARFFSFRRDGVTGRLSAAIGLVGE